MSVWKRSFCSAQKRDTGVQKVSQSSVVFRLETDQILEIHYINTENNVKSSPISLSWMSALKMELGCSVVMGVCCKSYNKVQSMSHIPHNHPTFPDSSSPRFELIFCIKRVHLTHLLC